VALNTINQSCFLLIFAFILTKKSKCYILPNLIYILLKKWREFVFFHLTEERIFMIYTYFKLFMVNNKQRK